MHLGENHLKNETDCDWDGCADPRLTVGFDQLIRHPQYSCEKNDIGLIYLSKMVHYTTFIQPICLPSTSGLVQKPMDIDTPVQICGWGSNGSSNLRLTLTLHNLTNGLFSVNAVYETYESKMGTNLTSGIELQGKEGR